MTKTIAEASNKPEENALQLERVFNELANTWYRETGVLSFISQKALHPCYQRIIGMGRDALPFIFGELNKGKGDWIWALECITRLDKNTMPAGATFKETVSMWLQWGRNNGYC